MDFSKRGRRPKTGEINMGLNVAALFGWACVFLAAAAAASGVYITLHYVLVGVTTSSSCPSQGSCQVGLSLGGACSAVPAVLPDGTSCDTACYAPATAAGESQYCSGGTCIANTECLGDNCVVDGDCPDIGLPEILAYGFKTCTGVRGNCYYFYSNYGDLYRDCWTDAFQEACLAMLDPAYANTPCLTTQPLCISRYVSNSTTDRHDVFIGCAAYYNCATFQEDLVVRDEAMLETERPDWDAVVARANRAAAEAVAAGPMARRVEISARANAVAAKPAPQAGVASAQAVRAAPQVKVPEVHSARVGHRTVVPAKTANAA